jgi:hypothetical protein
MTTRAEGFYVWPSTLDELIDDQVQEVFDRHGPERDRGTDWRKSLEEPWRALAGALDGERLLDLYAMESGA